MENCDRLEMIEKTKAEVSNPDANKISKSAFDTGFQEYWKGEEIELADIRRKVDYWIENKCVHLDNCQQEHAHKTVI